MLYVRIYFPFFRSGFLARSVVLKSPAELNRNHRPKQRLFLTEGGAVFVTLIRKCAFHGIQNNPRHTQRNRAYPGSCLGGASGYTRPSALPGPEVRHFSSHD